MKYPSEEEIQSIISELNDSSEFHHQNTELYGECEMCAFESELNRRGSELKDATLVDNIMMSLLLSDRQLSSAVAVCGPKSVHDLMYCTRAAFYIGYKTGLAHSMINELEKMTED